jgi:hypothetical protein
MQSRSAAQQDSRSKAGRSRLRADELIADRGYDTKVPPRAVGEGGVKPVIARRHARPSTAPASDGAVGSSSAPSSDCTFSADYASAANAKPRLNEAFVHLGCAIIGQRYLRAL